jgi:hypothetical protein
MNMLVLISKLFSQTKDLNELVLIIKDKNYFFLILVIEIINKESN